MENNLKLGNEAQLVAKKPVETVMTARMEYTSSQTCHLLGGMSNRTLRRLEQRGLIRPIKALRTKLWAHSEIQRFLQEAI